MADAMSYLFSNDGSGPLLASRYGVSRWTINSIKRKKTWKSIHTPEKRRPT